MRWILLPARFMQAMRLDRIIDGLGLSRLLPQKLQRMHALLPKLPPRTRRLPETLPAQGTRRARVALFTGCVADAMFGATNWATARVLQANGCEVVVPRDQGCCGAIHYHSGAAQPSLEFANANTSAFDLNDIDAVIVNVAGCGSMLKDYGHIADELVGDSKQREEFNKFAGKVRDVSEFLMELGPREPRGEIKLRATYHDACHLVHAQQVRDQPRELLEMIPGLELVPLDESEICCGAAGSYNLTEPEMANRLGQRKVKNILATNSQAVILGNAGCSLQIQAQLRAAGSNIWVAHPMDLLDLSYRQLKPPVADKPLT
jgi:glycolate oxidase iron-sulfur subunit